MAWHWGPERIETGWWRGASVRRDYYRVQTEESLRFWLFRNLADDRWYLHGDVLITCGNSTNSTTDPCSESHSPVAIGQRTVANDAKEQGNRDYGIFNSELPERRFRPSWSGSNRNPNPLNSAGQGWQLPDEYRALAEMTRHCQKFDRVGPPTSSQDCGWIVLVMTSISESKSA